MKYRILSIDGGGTRGVYAARILLRLLSEFPDLIKNVDLLTGASIGGVLLLGVGFGTSVSDCEKLLVNNFPAIFADSWYDDMKDLGTLLGADYSTDNMKKVVQNHFGNTTLGQLKKKVLIPAVDLDNEAADQTKRKWKPKFYNNFQQDDADQLVYEVALRATAAPTYFPTFQGFIDGGVVINNPSVAGLCQALDSSTGNQQLSDISLLSIGTGMNPAFVSGDNLDWGLSNWAKLLVPMIIDNTVDISHYQCSKLLKDRYHRVNSTLSSAVALDNVKKIPELQRDADSVDLTDTVAWLKKNWV